MLLDETISRAKELAGRALEWNRKSLYASAQVQTGALDVLARIAILEKNPDEAVERYKACYLEGQNTVRYHFTMARFHLQQEHIQAAEREIWSIAELPERNKAEYLVLRGRIAAKKEQFENARLYLQQAEALAPLPQILLRELYRAMELCCKEIEDYQGAYQYAAKQLALAER